MIDAVLAYQDEGVVAPSAAEIAARAGVSERSVFRHFDDLEALAAEAVNRQFSRVSAYFEDPRADGPLEVRVAAFVDHRCRLYERMANLARAAAGMASRSASVALAVDGRHRMLCAQTARQFTPELEALPARDRRLLLASLDAAAGFESLDHLRTVGRIGPRDLKIVLATVLLALLTTAASTTAASTASASTTSTVPSHQEHR